MKYIISRTVAGAKTLLTTASSARLTASASGPYIPSSVVISSLSVSHAAIGAEVTITGTGFGAPRGSNTVSFGEPVNELGFAPCTKAAASYVSWADTSIVVTVPSMSPGKSGEAGTYHRVRVRVGGVESNGADFYIDPVTTVTTANANSLISTLWRYSGAGVTFSGSTYTATGSQGCDMASNTANVLFEGITFRATSTTINGNNAGVLTMGEGWTHNITFLDCGTYDNTGPGLGAGEWGVNGVKLKQFDTIIVEDINFCGFHFGRHSRMGIEAINEGADLPNQRLALTASNAADTIFEPAGTEAISWNGQYPMNGLASACYYLHDGVTIKGWGNDPSRTWSGAAFESNRGSYMEMRNMTIWLGSGGGAFNVNGEENTDHKMYFDNVDVRFDIVDASFEDTGGTEIWGGGPREGMVYRNCAFNLGTSSVHADRLATVLQYGDNSSNIGWHNDFSGVTCTGYVGELWSNGTEAQVVAFDNILPTYSAVIED